ncbi:hypothetical protein DENIT_10692 [Pseudomonas veronii]|nr:hypothetical protein DENIT_10692 [Pseudomonas veronii]
MIEYARMNAQSAALAQALILFVASYKNCSSFDTKPSDIRANPQRHWVLASWHSPCSTPSASAQSALLLKVNADDPLAYRV